MNISNVMLLIIIYNTISMSAPFLFKLFHITMVLAAFFISGLIMGPIFIVIGLFTKTWVFILVGLILFGLKK